MQKYATEAVNEFGLHLLPQFDEGKNVLQLCGQLSTYTGNISEVAVFGRPPELDQVTQRLDDMCREVPVDAPYMARSVKEWDRQTFEEWVCVLFGLPSHYLSLDLCSCTYLHYCEVL